MAASIFQNLGPMLFDEYLVLSAFYPFLEGLVGEDKESHIARAISLMQLCLEVIDGLKRANENRRKSFMFALITFFATWDTCVTPQIPA